LLDVDPDLAAGLDGEELAHAREHAILPKLVFERAPWPASGSPTLVSSVAMPAASCCSPER